MNKKTLKKMEKELARSLHFVESYLQALDYTAYQCGKHYAYRGQLEAIQGVKAQFLEKNKGDLKAVFGKAADPRLGDVYEFGFDEEKLWRKTSPEEQSNIAAGELASFERVFNSLDQEKRQSYISVPTADASHDAEKREYLQPRCITRPRLVKIVHLDF
jgi:hypothetical protein